MSANRICCAGRTDFIFSRLDWACISAVFAIAIIVWAMRDTDVSTEFGGFWGSRILHDGTVAFAFNRAGMVNVSSHPGADDYSIRQMTPYPPFAIACDNSSQLLAAVTYVRKTSSQRLFVWNTDSLDLVSQRSIDGTALSFLGASGVLLIGTEDGRVAEWRVSDDETTTFQAHPDAIELITPSDDGKSVATVSTRFFKLHSIDGSETSVVPLRENAHLAMVQLTSNSWCVCEVDSLCLVDVANGSVEYRNAHGMSLGHCAAIGDGALVAIAGETATGVAVAVFDRIEMQRRLFCDIDAEVVCSMQPIEDSVGLIVRRKLKHFFKVVIDIRGNVVEDQLVLSVDNIPSSFEIRSSFRPGT